MSRCSAITATPRRCGRRRGEPGYRGEAWTDEGEVRPLSWSPNRIVLQVEPGQEVFINQNPGSWWRVNGRRAFPGMRCAEPMQPFAVRADDDGRLVLETDPPGLPVGIALHVVGAVLVIATRRSGLNPKAPRPA